MPRRVVTRAELREALAVAAAQQTPTAGQQAGAEPQQVTAAEVASAVRTTARYIADQHPGRTVEIRIPPYIAVQAFAGLRHTRGTPPNVIETDAATWLGLVTGVETWQHATAIGAVRASGTRADISDVLPLQVE